MTTKFVGQDLEMFSILLQRDGPSSLAESKPATYRADFLALDLVADRLVTFAPILITEGPKVVGRGRMTRVFHAEIERQLDEMSRLAARPVRAPDDED